VPLERQNIEKKDFPYGRRGYDPDAVDAHLSAIADQVEGLKQSARRRAETLASSASEQVRAIVEAAENTAAEIQRQAEQEAREIREDATEEASRTREQATDQAREYVGRVSESTAVMLQRLDAMESELGALIEALRTGANRLNADLQLLEGNLTELQESAAPRPRFEPEPGAAEPLPPLEPAPADVPAAEEHQDAGLFAEEAAEQEGAYDAAPGEPDGEIDEYDAAQAAPEGSDDTEGARLIALNMALNGTPRDETDQYLAANFELADRGALLDEVYASVEG
jgi:DivIVA domain-containing protein